VGISEWAADRGWRNGGRGTITQWPRVATTTTEINPTNSNGN